MEVRICSLFFLVAVVHGAAGIKGKFIQLNDFHFDPSYNTTGESCHEVVPWAKRLPYGNYICDSSRLLTESSLNMVNQEGRANDTDFIIWAGDIVTHVREPEFLNEEKWLSIINTTSHLMAQKLGNDVPIFPMLGNHDYFPRNQLPSDTSGDRLYGVLADILCPLFIGDQACTTFRKAGYFSKVLDNKIRVIILNSNLYLEPNRAVPKGEKDPAGQFQWLRDELDETKRLSQKALVFAHVPPGFAERSANIKFFKEDYNKMFVQILRDFSDVIIGVFCGHTHTDSFRVIYSKEDPKQPKVSLFIAPSVTPWRRSSSFLARNPAIRSVLYDTTAPYKLKEYIQYYLPLDQANDKDKETVEWQEEYYFQRDYAGINDLSPQSLHDLVTNFRESESVNFQKYFDLNSVSIQENANKLPGNYYCDKVCKKRHICSIENVDFPEYISCMDEEPESNLEPSEGCQFRSTLWMPIMALVVAKHFFCYVI